MRGGLKNIAGWCTIALAAAAAFYLNETRMAVLSYGTFLAYFLGITLLTVIIVFSLSDRR